MMGSEYDYKKFSHHTKQRNYKGPAGCMMRTIICKGLLLLQEIYKTIGATTTPLLTYSMEQSPS
jgi:hypothetical protein